MNRRGFLQLGVNAVASSSVLATLGSFERVLAAAPKVETTGYRALVCLYMNGGNDSFNTLIPRSTDAYQQYASARGDLAVPRRQLLPIHPQVSDGNDYGLHPGCDGIQQLFDQQALSFVANVGSLVEPVTRDQYRAGTAVLPLQLFSHEDQSVQWHTARAVSTERIGWAGRVADLMAEQGYSPKLSVNISLDGTNIWQSGRNTIPYTLGLGGAPVLDIMRDNSEGLAQSRRAAFLELLQQGGADDALISRQFAATNERALEFGRFINDAIYSAPEFQTQFPADHLGMQLKMVARSIRARERLGANRQLYFVSIVGFDTHASQLQQHPRMLSSISDGLKAFYDATVEMGAQDLVTTFTTSDFGRTLTSNGGGTDHGWGAHHMVMGGAVRGQNIFGRMPDLTLNGPDDVDSGRIIPTQAIDQYAATLARWFGLSDSDLNLVFPNLANFASNNLGFMG